MKKFLNRNKVSLMNLLFIITIVVSYVLKIKNYATMSAYLRAFGVIGLASSIINYCASQVVLNKLSFLYTVDKIREYLLPIKMFLIKDLFGAKDFDDLRKKYKKLLTSTDKKKIEKNVQDMGFNNVVKAFVNDKVKNLMKANMMKKIFEIEDAIKIKIINGLTDDTKRMNAGQFFKQEILPIIENKMELSVLTSVHSTIFDTVKSYFNWLVLWGGFSGAIAGLIFQGISYL